MERSASSDLQSRQMFTNQQSMPVSTPNPSSILLVNKPKPPTKMLKIPIRGSSTTKIVTVCLNNSELNSNNILPQNVQSGISNKTPETGYLNDKVKPHTINDSTCNSSIKRRRHNTLVNSTVTSEHSSIGNEVNPHEDSRQCSTNQNVALPNSIPVITIDDDGIISVSYSPTSNKRAHFQNTKDVLQTKLYSSENEGIELDDNRLKLTAGVSQPQHLHFTKPTNSLLKIMRKSNQADLAGYNPQTGGFEVEYEDSAEEMLVLASELIKPISECDMKENVSVREMEDRQCLFSLGSTLVDAYCTRIHERNRIKTVLKDHGLMNQEGTQLVHSKLEYTLTKSQIKKLLRFTHLQSKNESDSFHSCVELMGKLSALENKMSFYRSQHGVTTKKGIEVCQSTKLNFKLCQAGRKAKERNSLTPEGYFRKFRGMPQKEFALCLGLNITPENYVKYKTLLVEECQKSKGVTLMRARKLLKIDVNKTRQIFDSLLEEGVIHHP